MFCRKSVAFAGASQVTTAQRGNAKARMRTPDSHPINGRCNRSEQLSTRIAFFMAGFAVSALGFVGAVRQGTGRSWRRLTRAAFAVPGLRLHPGNAARRLSGLPLRVPAAVHCRGYSHRRLAGQGWPLLLSAFMLGVALLVFGAGVGTADCVVNIQAVIRRGASAASSMSGFYGLFSVGGMGWRRQRERAPWLQRVAAHRSNLRGSWASSSPWSALFPAC